MAWIQSHQELGQHPKLIRLARMLGISEPTAVGHLQYLWWWALDYAPDGHIVGYDSLDLAIGAKWDGDPDKFVQTLVDCGGNKAGFLDVTDDGWFIHDWPEFGGKLHARRVASEKANHTRHHVNEGITAPDCQFCASERSPNGVRTESERSPNGSAADSREEKSREEKKTLGAADATQDRDPVFETVAEVCGLDWREGLPDTERGRLNKAVKELKSIDATPDQIRAKARGYRNLYPNATLTPQALTGNWGQVEAQRTSRREQFCDQCPGDRRHLPDCPRYERMREVV